MPWGEDDFVAIRTPPVVKFTVDSTQEDLDAGNLNATIHITPTPADVIAETVTKLTQAIERKLTRALVGFHFQEGRWPAWAWVEDWRKLPHLRDFPDSALTAIQVPEVTCGDSLPDDAYTTYKSGILNDRPDLAVEFFRRAAALEGLEV